MEKDKSGILAHRQSSGARRKQLRWLVVLSSIPLFGIVTAFGTAPQTITDDIPIRTVVESLSLPATNTGNAIPAGEYWQSERIQRGDTVSSLLYRLGASQEDALALLRSARDARALRQLVPGKLVQVRMSIDGELIAFRYLNGDSQLIVEKSGQAFQSREETVSLAPQQVMKSGIIRHSLYGAADSAGVPDAIIGQMVEIFSTDIDFHLDLRKGDRFSIVYEILQHNGDTIKTGRILSAEFINAGKSYQAVYFKDREGRDGYYTPDGKNLRKAFLRSPIEFSRISSGFSGARLHPVLKEVRAHKGVDYAAPTGTRVRATADGTVEFIGRQGGYGNVIAIKHHGNHSTLYGHLSGFASGLKKGDRVSQGAIIGFVGSTGLASGPHLHYEFKVAGVQKDPLSVALPTAVPLADVSRQDFMVARQPLVEKLNLLRGTNLALLD